MPDLEHDEELLLATTTAVSTIIDAFMDSDRDRVKDCLRTLYAEHGHHGLFALLVGLVAVATAGAPSVVKLRLRTEEGNEWIDMPDEDAPAAIRCAARFCAAAGAGDLDGAWAAYCELLGSPPDYATMFAFVCASALDYAVCSVVRQRYESPN